MTKFYSVPLEIDIFSNKNPIRDILEILYFLFNMFFFSLQLMDWWKIWKIVRTEEMISKYGSKATKRVLEKINGKAKKENGCLNMLYLVLIWIKNAIISIIKFGLNILTTTKKHIQADTFNSIDLISIIMSIMNSYTIFQLYINHFIRNFTSDTASDYEIVGEFAEIDTILENYRVVVAFNCLIIFFRILQYYKFDRRLNLFSKIIYSSRYDLGFFTLMFGIILLSYSLMGHLLLGHILIEYSSLSRAILSSYLIVLGSFNSNIILDADPIFGVIFYISLIILFVLILLNMFIAIITSHYYEVTKENQKEAVTSGFFSTIYKVLQAKWKKEKFLPVLNEKHQKKPNLPEAVELKELNEEEYEIIVKENNFSNYGECFYWLKILENLLQEKTEKRISFFEMKSRSGFKDVETIIAPASLSEICYFNEQMWKNESIAEKLKV